MNKWSFCWFRHPIPSWSWSSSGSSAIFSPFKCSSFGCAKSRANSRNPAGPLAPPDWTSAIVQGQGVTWVTWAFAWLEPKSSKSSNASRELHWVRYNRIGTWWWMFLSVILCSSDSMHCYGLLADQLAANLQSASICPIISNVESRPNLITVNH